MDSCPRRRQCCPALSVARPSTGPACWRDTSGLTQGRSRISARSARRGSAPAPASTPTGGSTRERSPTSAGSVVRGSQPAATSTTTRWLITRSVRSDHSSHQAETWPTISRTNPTSVASVIRASQLQEISRVTCLCTAAHGLTGKSITV